MPNLLSGDPAGLQGNHGQKNKEITKQNNHQWMMVGDLFFPAASTKSLLCPGLYAIGEGLSGVYFQQVNLKDEHLILFPGNQTEQIVQEIQTFWDREEQYNRYNLAYKRGMLLHGRPGGGKSSVIRLVINDVIARGGVTFVCGPPSTLQAGLETFRKIQPNTPIVVIMEDIDSLFNRYNQSEILNLLDGVTNIHKIVFLATTNYLEKLQERITNRPSRFDKLFEIGPPCAMGRRVYLESLLKIDDNIPLDQWINDTEGFMVSHLKELFITVHIIGNDYNESIKRIKDMIGSIPEENEVDIYEEEYD